MSHYPVISLSKDFLQGAGSATITCIDAGLWEATITVEDWRIKDARLTTIRQMLHHLQKQALESTTDLFDVVAGYLYRLDYDEVEEDYKWRRAKISDMEYLRRGTIANFLTVIHTTCKWMSLTEIAYGLSDVVQLQTKTY